MGIHSDLLQWKSNLPLLYVSVGHLAQVYPICIILGTNPATQKVMDYISSTIVEGSAKFLFLNVETYAL